MEPFLRLVAAAYAANEGDSLHDLCFVFPNKRSGTFFRHYLSEEMPEAYIEPEITTISDFTASFSDDVEATRYEQLFILYNEYRRILLENGSEDFFDFDKFQFWGDMLLNDFGDVDRYLVDPAQLFINVQRYREIKSDYLTDEQREIISRYWGDTQLRDAADNFWLHFQGGESVGRGPKGSFLRLWEILLELYQAFRKLLAENGLCYNGMFYRNAVERLKEIPADELPYRRIVFVGFNVLSTSEIKIFELLRDKGLADFYWDYNSPVFAAGENRSTRFLKEYVGKFKSRYDYDPVRITTFPAIHVIGVPSETAQTQEASRIISGLVSNGDIKDVSNAIDTAIVLPDENLFIPLLHSIPPETGTINVTMGYPLRHSAIASLISDIVSMQLRARYVKDELLYFHEDITTLLNHPFIRTIAPDAAVSIVDEMREQRRFNIPATELVERYPDLSPLFTPVRDTKSTAEVFDYMSCLLDFIYRRLPEAATTDSESDTIDRGLVVRYMQSLDELRRAVDRFGITMHEKTFFQILERTISGESVNFIGEPLHGLQIMGVLETRALNFDNVIILSMNERVFPRKHYTRSLIPNALRHGYGMATIDFQECIYAYYFYRLISRARNVYLIYDSRNSGIKSGEPSRYIRQLLYLRPGPEENLTRETKFFNIGQSTEDNLIIPKTPGIMERLRRYTTAGSGKFLSASAINQYINCPLEFYLEKVLDIRVPDEVTEYMDSSTYGTIVHEVAQKLYESLRGDRDEVVVTVELLKKLQHDRHRIEREITRSVNEHFNKRGKEDYTPLDGEARVLGIVMVEFIVSMFKAEEVFAPFAFIEGELKIEHRWKITDDITINIKQYIDRLDRLTGHGTDGLIRIVDYKTGGDRNDAGDVGMFFDRDNPDRRKALLQLFIYCNVLADSRRMGQMPIQPVLYLLKTVANKGLTPVKIGGEEVVDYNKYNTEFMERFRGVIEEMFNPDIPFRAATDDHACKYCKFKAICNKS
ncbi:MAG: PD-(D/E)XK nuclease family protein [Pseudoflavonifractor sp.]|nr:PD-(D/E)XK nuclease family protein [Pseudoflavonifractor sp.]